jgi:hypothetical protein
MLNIKESNKREKLKYLTSYCMNLFKNGSLGDGVEGICDIHL